MFSIPLFAIPAAQAATDLAPLFAPVLAALFVTVAVVFGVLIGGILLERRDAAARRLMASAPATRSGRPAWT